MLGVAIVFFLAGILTVLVADYFLEQKQPEHSGPADKNYDFRPRIPR